MIPTRPTRGPLQPLYPRRIPDGRHFRPDRELDLIGGPIGHGGIAFVTSSIASNVKLAQRVPIDGRQRYGLEQGVWRGGPPSFVVGCMTPQRRTALLARLNPSVKSVVEVTLEAAELMCWSGLVA